MFHIGHISKSHGLNGHFSIKLSVPRDLCHLFGNLQKIYLEDHAKPFAVKSSILNNNIFLKTKVDNINSREEAKLLLRKNIYIKKGDHIDIDKAFNEKNKLLNFKVIDKRLGEIGIIQNIEFDRPQALLFVKSQYKTVLIPYEQSLIININDKKQEITLDLPEGIIDICSE
tara:strand:- start:2916 stop:3428 length:513 start_codon:yes stop_codon:yes gene_type:complete